MPLIVLYCWKRGIMREREGLLLGRPACCRRGTDTTQVVLFSCGKPVKMASRVEAEVEV